MDVPVLIPLLQLNQSISIDVVLTHPLDGDPDRIRAAESFLDICGEPLVAPALMAHIEEMASSHAPSLQVAENRRERREEIIKELLETERNYLRKINALIEATKIRAMVLEGLQRGSDRYYVNAIFYNISAIAQVSQLFIRALEQTMLDEATGDVVSAIANHIHKSSATYQSYLLNYGTAIERLRQFQESHRAYKLLLKQARSLKSCDRLSIADLLVQPVQRIPRYALIVTSKWMGAHLLRYTHAKHPDHARLVDILATVDSIGSLHGYQDKDRLTQLNGIRATVHGCPEQLLSASRTFLAQLEVSEIEPATFAATRAVTLFLFCDTVLFAERTSSGLRSLAWTSVLDLALTGVGEQVSSSGFLLRYGGSDTSAGGYWGERVVRQYAAHSEQEGARFRMLFYDTWAALRMKVNNCKTYVQCYNNSLQVYINIYDTHDLYEKAVYKQELGGTCYHLPRQMAYNHTWLGSVRSLKLAAQPIVQFTQTPASSRTGRRDHPGRGGALHKGLQTQYLSRLTRAVGSVTSRDAWPGRHAAMFRSADTMLPGGNTGRTAGVASRTHMARCGSEVLQNRRATLNISSLCETGGGGGRGVRPEGSWVDLRRSDSNSSRSTQSSSSKSHRSLERMLRSTWDSVCAAVGDMRDRRASSFMADGLPPRK
ncbi:hypothetical protein SYNPS1DRAFT_24101 [Syncephalis pseudoplumigaleata]|uniref:DH domain-containing protein n=1 Tax=Syncephalis pseudoplumigaleata TaxID=1712513 RepID=A0A4V1J149_9FUNG|nr:hypothetical protein SYNPS1DRAFT_24101 [Syncephalis pseudoplumigaleata]|eukprot:RKP23819.1 hypothetical protein SYNPS1DRAFT_24101 [Syncephalis pseudoplumigaleata]